MPILCQFLGIIMSMYYGDHAPPHFHARYGEYEITVDVLTGLIKGQFPKRALRLVLEWYDLHKEELLDNWERCQRGELPLSIQPLE